MRKGKRLIVVATLMVLVAAGAASAAEISLNAVTFPERDTVRLDFIRQAAAPAAEVKAKVKIREGQAGVEIKFKDMKPAVNGFGVLSSSVRILALIMSPCMRFLLTTGGVPVQKSSSL